MENIKEFELKATKIDNILTIEGNFCPKPYERNRKNGIYGHMYDPLSTYKKQIKKLVDKALKEINYDKPLNHYFSIGGRFVLPIPKSSSNGWTNKKKLYALKGIIKPENKDIDNIMKTTMDLLTNYVYTDDDLVYKFENIDKAYGFEGSFKIYLTDEGEVPVITGRMNKEEKLEWKNIVESYQKKK